MYISFKLILRSYVFQESGYYSNLLCFTLIFRGMYLNGIWYSNEKILEAANSVGGNSDWRWRLPETSLRTKLLLKKLEHVILQVGILIVFICKFTNYRTEYIEIRLNA